jgi:hypothetical protein
MAIQKMIENKTPRPWKDNWKIPDWITPV